MPETKFGKIIFQTANAGSKSESVQPFLVEADGTMTQVFLKGDNPFMNTTLRTFEGKEVSLSGMKKEGSVIFTANEIKENPIDPIEENTISEKGETESETKSIEENTMEESPVLENEVQSENAQNSENPLPETTDDETTVSEKEED